MAKKGTYEEMEYILNTMGKICTNLQIDKANLNDLKMFQKKEIKQLKQKIRDLEFVCKNMKENLKTEVSDTIN